VMNIGYQTGTTATTNWVPFNGTSETTGSTASGRPEYPSGALDRCTFIAPYTGLIKRVCWRCEANLDSKEEFKLIIGLYEATAASEVPNVSGVVGATFKRSVTTPRNVTVTFDPPNWLLSAGDIYAIRVETPDSASLDSVMTVVVEYNPELSSEVPNLGDKKG
jgi:hypothetical protein